MDIVPGFEMVGYGYIENTGQHKGTTNEDNVHVDCERLVNYQLIG